IYVFVFFSSRRRHTRSKRDWSSDVCSSDILGDVDELHWQYVLPARSCAVSLRRCKSTTLLAEGLWLLGFLGQVVLPRVPPSVVGPHLTHLIVRWLLRRAAAQLSIAPGKPCA